MEDVKGKLTGCFPGIEDQSQSYNRMGDVKDSLDIAGSFRIF